MDSTEEYKHIAKRFTGKELDPEFALMLVPALESSLPEIRKLKEIDVSGIDPIIPLSWKESRD